jgi:hypothetical protein
MQRGGLANRPKRCGVATVLVPLALRQALPNEPWTYRNQRSQRSTLPDLRPPGHLIVRGHILLIRPSLNKLGFLV